MAKVDLVYVVRRGANPIVLTMTFFVEEFVRRKCPEAKGPDAEALSAAFYRLMSGLGAVLAGGYDRYQVDAICRLVGMGPALLERLSLEGTRGLLEELRKLHKPSRSP